MHKGVRLTTENGNGTISTSSCRLPATKLSSSLGPIGKFGMSPFILLTTAILPTLMGGHVTS